MAVKCLSTGLKLFGSRRVGTKKARLQKSRRGDWRRQGRGMVGMAGGRGGAASLVVGKVEGREFSTIDRVSSSSTTRYIRYTRLHAHIFRFLLLRPWTWTYKLASLRLPLLWPLYTCREKLCYENRCHVCYL